MAGLMTEQERPAAMGAAPTPPTEGAGAGVPMPEASGDGEAMATPEQQQVYERFVAKALLVIYDQAMMPKILDMISVADPKKGLATATAMVVGRVLAAAQKAGQEVDGDILLHAGTEIFEDLANLATVAGIYDFNGDQDALEGAFFLALDEFRTQNAGAIDPEPFKRDLSEMEARDKDGELANDFMALEGGSEGEGEEPEARPPQEQGKR